MVGSWPRCIDAVKCSVSMRARTMIWCVNIRRLIRCYGPSLTGRYIDVGGIRQAEVKEEVEELIEPIGVHGQMDRGAG